MYKLPQSRPFHCMDEETEAEWDCLLRKHRCPCQASRRASEASQFSALLGNNFFPRVTASSFLSLNILQLSELSEVYM